MSDSIDVTGKGLGTVAILEAGGVECVVHGHAEIRTVHDIRTRTEFPVERSVKAIAFVTGAGRVLLAAVPGPARVRYGPLAAAVGVRRAELAPAGPEVLARLGMEPGGVSPVCGDPEVTVVFDRAVPTMGRIFCGSGRADHTLEVEAADLVRATGNAVLADIATTG